MIEIKKDSEPDNDWANDVKDNPIHISKAKSGLNDYYCMGCNKVMQAVKMKNPKHQSYFRHHIKDIDTNKIECVHSSKEYRERLAYFYFMRVKQIKVPAVYKYPPKGEEGIPVLLEEAKTIVAHRVEREVTVYEDENGKIHWDKIKETEKIDDRFLWIRPDAVFYDINDKPILFLEFVVTHKPDEDKLNKLQRLGINTVQIIVPKLSEAEIEKSISSVSKVKWTFNEIESNTEYLPISTRNTEGIPFIDEEQRKLFEESYKCRKAQLNNLIHSIKRRVESESYRRIEYLFEQEISRIEKATTEHQSRLDDIQRAIDSEIHSDLGERRGEFDKRNQEFREHSEGLETRYFAKRFSIITKRRDIDREIELRHNIGRTEEEIREEYRRIEENLRREFEKTERRYYDEMGDCEFETDIIDGEEREILRDIEDSSTFERYFTGKEESIASEFEQLEEEERIRFERERDIIKSKLSEHKKDRDKLEDGIRSEFERKYQQIIERVNNRDVQGKDELSDRIKTILEIRRLFDSYSDGKETLSRYQKGRAIIKDGTWKKWN